MMQNRSSSIVSWSESVTTFGVRTSRGNSSSTAQQNALRQSGDQAESQKENKVLTV